jgi:5-methylcytosine-specific restriction enzyme subunit McrC
MGYESVVQVPMAPRGRFLFGDTIKRNSLVSGRLVCQFDDLSADIPLNRIIKAALQKLLRSPDISCDLADDMRTLVRRMPAVRTLPLTRELFRPLQLTRNSGYYGFLMQVCELVFDQALPEEGGTGSRFADILEDEVRMSTVFESFIKNFYRREQSSFSAGSEIVEWEVKWFAQNYSRYMPAMRTDVTLRSPRRTIVIDAKFYRQTLVSWQGGGPKVRSDHLYQLLAYLRNMEKDGGVDANAEGVLLYPAIGGKNVRLDMFLVGHRLRVWTLDLSQRWQDVHNQLLQLIGEPPAYVSHDLPRR